MSLLTHVECRHLVSFWRSQINCAWSATPIILGHQSVINPALFVTRPDKGQNGQNRCMARDAQCHSNLGLDAILATPIGRFGGSMDLEEKIGNGNVPCIFGECIIPFFDRAIPLTVAGGRVKVLIVGLFILLDGIRPRRRLVSTSKMMMMWRRTRHYST
jgi:hypothetical protein